ncbi:MULTISPECIES: glycosyltransferase [unclassified Cellulosimicrobium]|uniref:glycosyltransferase n=1 Tax=unclassified Cellulosimicrobium TaxID=2624466 RepID=UPI0011A953B5|nr:MULTISPECIES: glycosyltransferase [unclassified Cellulosimicrobium]
MSGSSPAPAPAPRVVAVVVAYNRRDLLTQALDALAAQDRPLDAVVVVDNASDDGSKDVAAAHPVRATVIPLEQNTGGAGGFATGIAHAVDALSADLVWLMDDDTIPTPAALSELLRARERYDGPVAVLGSRVVWHDGRDHPMNTPRTRPGASPGELAAARAAGATPVRSSSFVSMLVDARAVRYHGLPVADYFIWNDDFEYSARLLRRGTGLAVPTSVVEHRTKTFGATDADPGERFYFEVRNKTWMLTRSSSLAPAERLLYGGASLRRWARTLRRSDRRDVLVRSGAKGLRDGLLRAPRTNAEVLSGAGTDVGPILRLDGGRGGKAA